MNFSGISAGTVIGRVLRFALSAIPKGMKMPILQGRSRGMKWIVGSSTHGCWLGSYEYDKVRLFERTVSAGSVVFDLGGHVGFYTLLSSILVHPDGKVVVFEPVPRNLFYLKEHLRVNRVKNVTVLEAAVTDRTGICGFDQGSGSSMGHLAGYGNMEVRTVSLDDMVSKG